MIVLIIFAILMIVVGIYTFICTSFNMLYFKKMEEVEIKDEGPLVSVIIPARDEEKNLPRLLKSLMNQTYKNIEILVINDQSSDRTQEIIDEYTKLDPRIKGYKTDPSVKYTKHGKMNALLQLIPYAKGEYLFATDADTAHASTSVAHTVAIMKKHNLDIISGLPTELCRSYWGSINISAMMFANVMIPHFLFYKIQSPFFAFAIGQFIMMRKDAYYEVGGYLGVKNTVVDDMGLVKLFTKHKKKYAFINASEFVACYMYSDKKGAFKGMERSISGVFPAVPAILAPVIFLALFLMIIAWAPLSLIFFLIFIGWNNYCLLLLIGWLLFWLGWFMGCRNTNYRKLVSISAPISITMICVMYVHGIYRRVTGKNFIWKGREI